MNTGESRNNGESPNKGENRDDEQWTDWYEDDTDFSDFSDFDDHDDDLRDDHHEDHRGRHEDDTNLDDVHDGSVRRGSGGAPLTDAGLAATKRSSGSRKSRNSKPERSGPQARPARTGSTRATSSRVPSSRGPSTRALEETIARPAPRGGGCLVSLIVVGLLAGTALWGVRWVQTQIDPAGDPGETIEVAIPRGTSATGLGPILHEQGVIGNPQVWRAWTQMNAVGSFQAGRYSFRKNSSFAEAVAVVKGDPTVPQQQPITIPPGFRLTQVADRVGTLPERSGQRFLEVARSGVVRSALLPAESAQNLEGFIAAETLNFDLADDETEILAKLVDEWDRIARDAGLMTAKDAVGYTPYEVLIVASLIEREAKFDDERGKVARVIYNRLKGDTALQLDATTVYDLGGGQPTAEDLKKDAPYNTYTRKGLPPTPIATPSVESIKAALAPTEGRSSFANTFQEHRRNIAKGKRNGAL
jgi:UPF0755 protein